MGWASLGGPPGKPKYFLSSLSFHIYFLFSISASVFEFGLLTKLFLELLEIVVGAKRIKPKLHKIFQNYWTYIYLIVDINPIRIAIDLIQRPKINISESPKILV